MPNQNDAPHPQKPPAAPWVPLGDEAAEGYLSFYHSDPLSPLAVRQVTRRRDNKSDPNVETGTYGLFSTCERGMRSGLVKKPRRWLFFVTKRETGRVLTGYYRVGWYSHGRPVAACKGQQDFALAADKWHFVDPPIPLETAARRLRDPALAARFRLNKIVTAPQAAELVRLLESREDATPAYVSEVRRLEATNRRFWGFHYVNWQRQKGFSWDDAQAFLQAGATGPAGLPAGFTASGGTLWTCVDCNHEIESESPLKQCPNCGAIGRQAIRTPT